jgi:sugar phosphate isomerase/epimerase
VNLTASTWPIAGATLCFNAIDPVTGADAQDAGPDEWLARLSEMRHLGFDHADLTDSWLRPGDMPARDLVALSQAASMAGVRLCSISAIRRPVIGSVEWADNLAYSHRTIDAAAALDIGVVSFGLHQALTEDQANSLWFWTVAGRRDPADPADRKAAVARFQELGRHAAQVGVVVSLEMYEDTFLGTASSAVGLIEEIGLPNVGLNPDIGNLIRAHRPVEDWRAVHAAVLPYANYWHVKNYLRHEDPDRGVYVTLPTRLEAGLIDYRAAFRLALAAGFQGIVTTETYGGDSLAMSAASRDYLRDTVLPEAADYSLGPSKVIQQVRRTDAARKDKPCPTNQSSKQRGCPSTTAL